MFFNKVFILFYKNFTFVIYEIEKRIAVKFHKQWYPGEVVDTSDNEIDIRFMGIIGKNKFPWPEKDNVCWYENSNIIYSIEPPTPVSQTAFGLCREDLEKVKVLM